MTRIPATFNPRIKEGADIDITLRARVLSVNKALNVARVFFPATGDEIAISANDDLDISFPPEEEETEILYEEGGIYMGPTGTVWVYNSKLDYAHPWSLWGSRNPAFNRYSEDRVKKPLRRVTLGPEVREPPKYEPGQVYRRKGGQILYIRTSDGWNCINARGNIYSALLPTPDSEMEKVS